MKPNCYECKYKSRLPGDSHVKCVHPAFKEILDNPAGQLLSLMGKHAGIIQVEPDKAIVKGNLHGIRNGWFNHPFNFDPVWLKECNGFTPKDEKETNESKVLG